ncbi:uncharacterized protein LY89DRAFT_310725 [Mollisia scopiformis]|uniref:Uncharacterized protein n=1 Tax=Mollisia scopiformis TaxID=149040 RepID=A0A194XRG5_MOLSC|nr:uncharacterized protein LY89DRAFT_310725 [Mollisia scopiformis]KUJ22783.1 hypothetical protein LY89DRAFT_310725 [Mollisia scopiformis]
MCLVQKKGYLARSRLIYRNYASVFGQHFPQQLTRRYANITHTASKNSTHDN